MGSLLKDILGLFGIVEAVYKRIKEIFIPKQAYAWQTLIYLSLYSWGISYFAVGLIQDIIAFFGWLFLIIGTAWYTTDDPLRVPGTFMPVGAVITGFLVSIFAFGNQETGITPGTIVFWPTISALITAAPEFFEGSGTDSKAQIPKPEVRQKVTILVASCMVLSCWIQFYFVMDNWLEEYPSLVADDFGRSTFIIRTENKELAPRNGILILDQLQLLVEEEITGKSWSEAEQWLINAGNQVSNLGKQVIERNIGKYEEKELWRLEPRVKNTKNTKSEEYILDLLSIWVGPTSKPQGYYLKKSCRVKEVAVSPINANTTTTQSDDEGTVAEIECDRLSKLIEQPVPPKL